MSRRFGRNQRRAMRQQMEQSAVAAQRQQEQVQNSLRLESERLLNLKAHWAEYCSVVADMVGRNALIAGEPTIFLTGPMFEHMLIPVYKPMPLMSYDSFMARSEIFQVEVMRLLEVDAVRDALAQEIHVTASLADKKAVYAVSHAALRRIKAPALAELIQHQLAPAIARRLASAIEAGARHGEYGHHR